MKRYKLKKYDTMDSKAKKPDNHRPSVPYSSNAGGKSTGHSRHGKKTLSRGGLDEAIFSGKDGNFPVKRKRKRFYYAVTLPLLIVFILATAFATFGALYAAATVSAVSLDKALLPAYGSASVIYDADGGELYNPSNVLMSVDELTEPLKNAFIATEDKRFYRHKGYDVKRIIGASLKNLKAKHLKEGASTISQQLIKNTHLSGERTINRKLKEIKLARELEKNFKKEEILTMYLNAAYFGKGKYGAKSAARAFFGKDIAEMSISECAVLAGTVKSPATYSPLASVQNSTERRNLVLRLMYEQGYISESEKNAFTAEKLILAPSSDTDENEIYSPYASAVLAEARALTGLSKSELLNGGFKIYTYMSSSSQAALYEVLTRDGLHLVNDGQIAPSVLGITADNRTAGITAFYSDVFGAAEMRRQAGSALKPFSVYAPALERGIINAATPVVDVRTDFGGFNPKNFRDVYYGMTTARESIAKSMNVPAVKFLSATGTDAAAAFLRRIEIRISDGDKSLALALGATANGTSPTELLGGYVMLARGGNFLRPTFISEIVRGGKLIYAKDTAGQTAMSAENAYILTDMLKDAVKRGTAKALSALPYDVAAKTGTVGTENSNSDAWSCAYTSAFSAIIWHGNATGSKESTLAAAESGGSYATSAVRELFKSMHDGALTYPEAFVRPDGIRECYIDKFALLKFGTLALAPDSVPEKYRQKEIFSESGMPETNSAVFSEILTNASADYTDRTARIRFDAKAYAAYDVFRIDKHVSVNSLNTAAYPIATQLPACARFSCSALARYNNLPPPSAARSLTNLSGICPLPSVARSSALARYNNLHLPCSARPSVTVYETRTPVGHIEGFTGRAEVEVYVFPDNASVEFEIIPSLIDDFQSGEETVLRGTRVSVYAAFDPEEFIRDR
ncbi:MAG: transglycosylase domain-containing protein [Clostridiaceae bacterium]|jgi:penicillin-binding protein 2A|nr:transglycosylase domain-containing protein [Clostridiaceae bacterium]